MSKVFLGGTCNNSTWRDELIPQLRVDYFNPVVKEWTSECQAEEEKQKNVICDIHLYVITPRMTGVFSIAEIIESTHNKRVKTVLCILNEDGDKIFDKFQVKSLKAVSDLAKQNGAFICHTLDEVAVVVNDLDDILTETDELLNKMKDESYHQGYTDAERRAYKRMAIKDEKLDELRDKLKKLFNKGVVIGTGLGFSVAVLIIAIIAAILV